MALTSLNHLNEILLGGCLPLRVYRYCYRGDRTNISTTVIRTSYHLCRIVLSCLYRILLCCVRGWWLLSMCRRCLVFWNRSCTSWSSWHRNTYLHIWIPQEGDISRSDSPPLHCLLYWLRCPNGVPDLILSCLTSVFCSVRCLFLRWVNLLFHRPSTRHYEFWHTWINRGRYVNSFLHLLIWLLILFRLITITVYCWRWLYDCYSRLWFLTIIRLIWTFLFTFITQ